MAAWLIFFCFICRQKILLFCLYLFANEHCKKARPIFFQRIQRFPVRARSLPKSGNSDWLDGPAAVTDNPSSLDKESLEEHTTLPANQRPGDGVTGANVLDAQETRLVPYSAQRSLRQNFKPATQEDNESIPVWVLWVRWLWYTHRRGPRGTSTGLFYG